MTSLGTHELDLDGLDLTGRTPYDGIRFVAQAKGATFGNPKPITREVMTRIVDGTRIVTTGHGNREPGFQVHIIAANSILIERGQAMLVHACRDGVILGWKPPDRWGKRMVLRAYTSQPDWVFDSDDELRLVRAFDLKIVADPWRYAEEPITVIATQAAPGAPSTVTISDGTDATGWTSPAGVTAPVVSSGKLKISPRGPGIENTYVSETTKAMSATDFSATQYVTAEITPPTGMRLWPTADGSAGIVFIQPPSKDGLSQPTQYIDTNNPGLRSSPAAWAGAYVDNAKLSLVNAQPLTGNTVRYTWRCTDPSATELRFVVGTAVQASTPPADKGFLIDNVRRSNENPAATSSGKAAMVSVVVAGSARSAPSVACEHPTKGLGEFLFYTSPSLGASGYGGPSTKSFLAGGAVTTSTSAVSGSYTRITSASPVDYASIPANQLPAGTYRAVTRLRKGLGTEPLPVTCTISQIAGSTEFGEVEMNTKVTVGGAGAGAGPWTELTVLGSITLPRQKAPPESSASVLIQLQADADVTDPYDVDDVWLFYMDEGSAYSRANCGANGSPSLGVRHSRAYIDIASAIRPDPGFYLGTAADRADAFDPGYPLVIARGDHMLYPGVTRAYYIATEADFPVVALTYTPAYA